MSSLRRPSCQLICETVHYIDCQHLGFDQHADGENDAYTAKHSQSLEEGDVWRMKVLAGKGSAQPILDAPHEPPVNLFWTRENAPSVPYGSRGGTEGAVEGASTPAAPRYLSSAEQS
jgi:hypothetical protein